MKAPPFIVRGLARVYGGIGHVRVHVYEAPNDGFLRYQPVHVDKPVPPTMPSFPDYKHVGILDLDTGNINGITKTYQDEPAPAEPPVWLTLLVGVCKLVFYTLGIGTVILVAIARAVGNGKK